MQGIFITFEGTEGAGKTTQCRLLEGYLKRQGFDVVMTREPGGTLISEKIRALILDRENEDMDYMTEALLYAAARAQHVSQLIQPAIELGKAVVCDRFLDSSFVYQGLARGLSIETIAAVNNFAVKDLSPDLTFFLKLSPGKGFGRKDKNSFDRLEMESALFHQKVYDGYVLLAEKFNDRIITINADNSAEEVHSIIVSHINEFLSQQRRR